MKIRLHTDTDLTITELHQPATEIVTDDPDLHYGAMQMFVSSLALCTFSVLASYGERIQAGVEDLSIRMRWSYAEKPYRIDRIDMAVRWPQLPESRLDAAMRAAALCTLHNTLQHAVEIDTMVDR